MRSLRDAAILMVILAALAASAARAREELAPPVARVLEGVRPPGPTPAGGELRDALSGQQGVMRLRAELRSADWRRRREVVVAAAWPGNITAVPFLGAALLRLDEHPRVRVAAAMSIGAIRFPEGCRYLGEALVDPDIEVRFAAALALASCESSVTILSKTLAEDGSWWVRSAAAMALGRGAKLYAVDALGDAAAGDSAWQVRLQAARALGELRAPRAAEALARPLRDEDAGVRGAAAIALGEIGGPEAIELVRAELQTDLDAFQRSMLNNSLRKLLGQPARPREAKREPIAPGLEP